MDTTDRTGAAAHRHDVVVIGAGPAGEVAAGRLAGAGLRVVIVERELVGGECSYWACIPSKALVRPGEVVAAARRVPGAAQAVTGSIDAGAAMARRDELVEHGDDAGQVSWLTSSGVDLIRGHGRLDGERRVRVSRPDGEVQLLEAQRAVIVATGSRATVPPVPGLAEVRPWDNRAATTLRQVPDRLLVLGGGPVGLELAQAIRRLGAREVSVIEAAGSLLAREEPFAGEQVRGALEQEGIVVATGVRLTGARRDPDGVVRLTDDRGREFVGDEVLVAAGRSPSTGDLGLESVGLRAGEAIAVDDRLRAEGVAGQWLHAVGDCNGIAPLTHLGKYQARIAADVILGKDTADRASRDVVPRVTFTDPQVAAVGLTGAQAAERGLRARTVTFETGALAGASVQANEYPGTSALVVDEERGVLVGATFVGGSVQELVHAATVAIAGQVPLDTLWHAVPSFPTVSEVWLRLLETYGL